MLLGEISSRSSLAFPACVGVMVLEPLVFAFDGDLLLLLLLPAFLLWELLLCALGNDSW